MQIVSQLGWNEHKNKTPQSFNFGAFFLSFYQYGYCPAAAPLMMPSKAFWWRTELSSLVLEPLLKRLAGVSQRNGTTPLFLATRFKYS